MRIAAPRAEPTLCTTPKVSTVKVTGHIVKASAFNWCTLCAAAAKKAAGHRGRHVAENSRKFNLSDGPAPQKTPPAKIHGTEACPPDIELLNSLTSSDPSFLSQLRMPASVLNKLLANDFDDWEDVAKTTMCSAAVLLELQRAVSAT